MTIKNTSVSLATVVLVLAGGLPLTAVAGHTYQTANMFNLHNEELVKGAATLTRSENSATARIYTTQLHKHSAYSIWWIVWNDPSNCVDGVCGDQDEDFGVEGNSVFYAGGFVTGEDGMANVSVHLEAGDLAEGIDVLIPGGLELMNGFGAEIHVVLRTHGHIVKGMADLQIGSFDGACDFRNCHDHQATGFPPIVP